jgi:hypothetical protein
MSLQTPAELKAQWALRADERLFISVDTKVPPHVANIEERSTAFFTMVAPHAIMDSRVGCEQAWMAELPAAVTAYVRRVV